MQFLSAHWHCILPVALIGAALLFMRVKPKDSTRKQEQEDEV